MLKKPSFRGQSIHRLDSKGRLRIPTKFREVLQKSYTDALIVSIFGNCLVAYPPEVWEEEIESRVRNFSQVDPEHRDFKRIFISAAEECEFDNQGRILLPPFLRESANLEQEVVLVGMLESFEIWGKSAWAQFMAENRGREREIMSKAAGAGL